MERFAAIWFPHLLTDWLTLKNPQLKGLALVITQPDHAKLKVTDANIIAEKKGIYRGMLLADAKAIVPELQVVDETAPDIQEKLLNAIGLWCIRFTPMVSLDLPDGLLLDITGCAHLWGGEMCYWDLIIDSFKQKGYEIKVAIADTLGAAWAMARFGKEVSIISPGDHVLALSLLPPAALRLEQVMIERLNKLGFEAISRFMYLPRSVLRRRFGSSLLSRLDQALGYEKEYCTYLIPIDAYQAHLPCLEPISTPTAIKIALQKLLETLCMRLSREGKGIRKAYLKCYRLDGKIVQVAIGTNRSSCHITHLFKLFELQIPSLSPGLGIELFILEASQVEEISPHQDRLWGNDQLVEADQGLTELLDRIAGKLGASTICRYLPQAHYWPERSVKVASSLVDQPDISWRTDRPRPMQLLGRPQLIEVMVPVPDYPPLRFRYQNQVHTIKRADGPERIEPAWWLESGEHRDYYQVEDENGYRYWIFRLGHYAGGKSQWFIHGFFA